MSVCQRKQSRQNSSNIMIPLTQIRCRICHPLHTVTFAYNIRPTVLELSGEYSSAVLRRRRTGKVRSHTLLFSRNNDTNEAYSSTSFPIFQEVRRFLSLVVFVLGINIGAIVIAVMLITRMYFALQSFNARKQENPSSSLLGNSNTVRTANRSSNEGGSQTALLALWGRSQAFKMKLPGASDHLAPLLMSKLSLFGRADEREHFEFELGNYLSAVCSSLSVLGYFITGAIFEDQIAYVATLGNTGLVSPMHCRTRWIDDVVDRFIEDHVDEHAAEIITTQQMKTSSNVLILGSGYDTRAYRMKSLRKRQICVYEIDAVGTSQEKRRVMNSLLSRESGLDPCKQDWLYRMPTIVTCDFESQKWMEQLVEKNFDASLPTLVVWEGVTMYLSLPVITETLNVLATRGRPFNLESDRIKSVTENQSSKAHHSSDWYIAFDYLSPGWANSQLWRFAMQFAREPIYSAFTKAEVDVLLNTLSLDVVEHLSEGEDIQRKFTYTSTKDMVGIMGNYGGFVLARTRNTKDLID